MIQLRPILLAEDNEADAELTIEALAENNLANRVTVCANGVEALDFLRCEGKYSNRTFELPSVILLDIKMPCMDGLETLREIRKDDRFKTLPVVMLTSSREEPDLKRSYELGANAYVVKPVNFTDFIEAVKQLGTFWGLINELP